MEISRRQLAGVVFASTAAVTVSGQAPPKPQPETDLDSAHQTQRAAAQAIARVALPMTVEPAFQFKA